VVPIRPTTLEDLPAPIPFVRDSFSPCERLGYRQEGYQPCQFYNDDLLVFGGV